MKDITEISKQLKEKLPLLSSKYKIEALGLFGSYVRNEQQENSGLDLLVSFAEPPSLLKFIELENYLSDILHTKVDLVMKEALKPNNRKKDIERSGYAMRNGRLSIDSLEDILDAITKSQLFVRGMAPRAMSHQPTPMSHEP